MSKNNWQPVLDSFLGTLRSLSPDTQRSYERYLTDFLGWLLGTSGGSHPWSCARFAVGSRVYTGPFTPVHVTTYLQTLTGAPIWRRRKTVTALRSFCQWGWHRGNLPSPYDVFLPLPSYRAPSRWVPKEPELQNLLAHALKNSPEPVRDFAIWILLAVQGLRVNELRLLSPDHFLFDEQMLVLPHTKTSDLQYRPLLGVAAEAVRNYLRDSGRYPHPTRLFVHSAGPCRSRPISKAWIEKHVAQTGEAAGLAYKLTPHTLRHVAATTAANADISLPSIQALLGHRSILSTQHYVHLKSTDLERIRDKIPWD